MIPIDDLDFLDLIYSEWTKTTGDEHTYWMSEEDEGHYAVGPNTWAVWAVDKEQQKQFIASFNHEVDADFTAAMHGCLGDLVRRAHTAIDEAERFECQRDEQEGRIADIVLEYEEQIESLQQDVSDADCYANQTADENHRLEVELRSVKDELEVAKQYRYQPRTDW